MARSHKIKSLKSSAQFQMTMLTAFSKEADASTEASHAMPRNIARSKRPSSDGKFMKQDIFQVASILHPSYKKVATSYFPDGNVKANYCASNWRPQCQCHLKMTWFHRLFLV